jgi:hypothetical protein
MALLKAINDMSLLRYHIEDISPVPQGTDIIEKSVPVGRFFHGWGGGIRTHAYSSQSAVSYRLTTPQLAVWSLEYGVLATGINHIQSFFSVKKSRKIY